MTAPILPPPPVDLEALRAYRLGRLRAEMDRHGLDLMVLVNPISLRYASDWREYASFQGHIPTYYLFVGGDGSLTMHGAYAETHPTIDAFEPAAYVNCFDGGLDTAGQARAFTEQLLERVAETLAARAAR